MGGFMIQEYFEKHPRKYQQMIDDWAATNNPSIIPTSDFINGWYMASKRANAIMDRAYEKYAELLSSNPDVSMSGYSKLLEDFWLEE